VVEGSIEQALDYAPTGIAVLTGDARVLWVNRRLSRMLRRDAADLVGLALEELTEPADLRLGEIAADSLAIGEMRDHGRKRFLRPDGNSVWGGIAVSRLPDGPEGPALVAHINDLSELMRAEEQLGQVVQGLDDGIVSFDPLGRVASANVAAARLLTIAEHALVGQPQAPEWTMFDEDGEAVPPDARPEAEVARTGKPAQRTLAVPVGDGTMRWLDVTANPIERARERWVVASYRDVSERARVEAQLRLSMAADRAKSEFLSRMSHELRTPLNVVLGYAQLLQMDDLAPQHRDSVEQIRIAGSHLLELVEDVLDLERIGRGRLEVALQPVIISPSLREVVELVQPLAEASAVTVEVVAAPADDVRAIADPRRLRQILLNLLTNAIKYNRHGGHVSITAHEIAGTVVVRVRDTGRGVPPNQLDQIFLPFERLGADALGIDGAGVGLALSKRLVETMGGRIGVESSVGVGSTFWFVVRAARDDAEETETPSEVEPVSAETAAELLRRIDGPPLRLLYIEDNPASRTMLEQLVERRGGFEILAAGTAAEGLRLARISAFDAVLVDLHLPDGSGEDIVRALRADPRTADVPVIVLTADATTARRELLMGMGAMAYLTKPLDAAELFLTLEGATPAVAT
jgi:PAS domain S-box-containing protein